MTRRKNGKVSEHERQVQIALAGLQDGTYMTVDQAVAALGVSKTTLHRRLKGGKSRCEAQEWRQVLTRQEEKALVKWISMSSATGNPVRYPFILEMAERLRESRVASASEFIPPLGPEWIKRFLRRHPHLKTKKSKAIETARIKEVTSEQVRNFNAELRRIIVEHNIQLENIFNVDETGIHRYIFANYRFFNWYSKWWTCCR
jgi:Tc5 transposase DNA-binding domain